MKFCNSCGAQLNDNAKFCNFCGATQNVTTQAQQTQYSQQNQMQYGQNSFNQEHVQQQQYDGLGEDSPGCLMNGLCFIIPLVGFILYFVKKDQKPISAKSYLTWSIAGLVLNIILMIAR